MKKKIKHIEECRKCLEIEIPTEEVNKRFEEFYSKISKTASISGFRAGKVPRDLLEKHYGERVTKEVIEELISDFYYKAVEESALVPLGLPQITDVKLDDAKRLSFNAEFNIRPKIDLKEYKNLKLKQNKIDIKETDVEKSMENLRDANAKFKETQDKAIEIGDYIICDSEIFVEGKPIGKKRENIWMPVEEKSYIPGLSGALVGLKPGEEKEIEVTLPEDFSVKEYVSKKALFKIKVKEVKEKTLPKIDDEFAKDLGYNNLSELKDSLKKLLESQAQRQVRHDLENQALGILLEKADFSVPSSLVESQLKHLVEQETEHLLKQGLKAADIKAKEKELRDKLMPLAVKQVKTMFILDEISHREKVKVSKSEIDEALEEIARYSRQSKESVEKYYNDNDLVSNLAADIRNKKVLDFLIKESKVEEGGQK